MPRESIADKGKRYVTEGRIVIERVDTGGGWVVARCRGIEGEYTLGFDPTVKQWRCGCAARGPCAHIYGLRLVIIR